MKLAEFNKIIEYQADLENVVDGLLSRFPQSLLAGNDLKCCNLSVVAVTSKYQFLEEQLADHIFGKF